MTPAADTPPPVRVPVSGGARVVPGLLVDRLPAILYVADPGIEARWHYVSASVEAILGFTPEEWLADPGLWARRMHPEDRDRMFARETTLDEPSVPDEYRLRHRDGRVVWVRDEATLVEDEPGVQRWYGVLYNISDRKLVEDELERRAEQQAAVATLGKQALAGAEFPELMRQALIEATRITGARSGAVFERDCESDALTVRASVGLVHVPVSGHLSEWLERTKPLPSELTEGVIGQIETADGHWGSLWLACNPQLSSEADFDFVQALANILSDAIRRRASEDAIRYRALHDELTGLANRTLLQEHLAAALTRSHDQLAVVLLDIDNFKLVNDSLGHAAGDQLLTQIAPRLRSVLRPLDMIARLSGDEFVVLLGQTGGETAIAGLAERIVAAFEEPFQLEAGEHFASASLGVAIATDDSRTPAGLIRDADAALYRAKARGRACFEVFDQAMRARTVERLSIENDLRRALERDELHVVYQPIVSLQDHSIQLVEALLRWQHPRRGMIAPDTFIPVAEETGMIVAIGRWVLEVACAQASRWQQVGAPSIGVTINLSARQFVQSALVVTVDRTLNETGLDPANLSLEITESVLLEDAERVTATMRGIARLGVRFLLDDFGTGYSSLAYLSDLPINGLKVDRSFVTTLGRDTRTTAITTGIVRMAQALGVDVIAEGVETDAQINALRTLGCELAQGFRLHRPSSAETISTLLKHQRSRPELLQAS
jgi:diguanylate cyclase (GGDEF)-like protein/PAS domain S-box-containing protein